MPPQDSHASRKQRLRARTTAKKSDAKKTPAKKTPAKKTAKKAAKKISGSESNSCWPGFEPVPGKAHNEKGSCKPKAGKKAAATKKADQKAAAASKLSKQGK